MTDTTAVQTWQCRRCGKQCERLRKPGLPPKYCSSQCKDPRSRHGTCEQCGVTYFGLGKRFCSVQCRVAAQTSNQEWLEAIRTNDWPAILAGVINTVDVDDNGCWLWRGALSADGYARRHFCKPRIHRLVMQAVHGGVPLGSQQVHHTCAVRRCVNPNHLQLATAAENNAEMRARNAYLRRIDELEAALREVAPGHPALSVAPYL